VGGPAAGPEARIAIQGLRKEFAGARGPVVALERCDFQVRDGEFIVIVGPSGCGKTTLLRILGGLESPTEGEVRIRRRDAGRPLTSMIFQEASIFPWMTVRANVGYGLMQGFVVTLDQERGRVRLASPSEEAGAEPEPVPSGPALEAPTEGRRSLGVMLQMQGDGLAVVSHVVPDSAAEKAGLAVGDSIRTVDGEPMTQNRLVAALMGTASIVLEVERGGETLAVVLYP